MCRILPTGRLTTTKEFRNKSGLVYGLTRTKAPHHSLRQSIQSSQTDRTRAGEEGEGKQKQRRRGDALYPGKQGSEPPYILYRQTAEHPKSREPQTPPNTEIPYSIDPNHIEPLAPYKSYNSSWGRTERHGERENRSDCCSALPIDNKSRSKQEMARANSHQPIGRREEPAWTANWDTAARP